MDISFKTFIVLILEQILKPIVSKNDFIQLVKDMFNGEKAFFNISYIRNNEPTIHCEKIKDILRYCYLNNILHLDKTEKIRFQKFLLKDDYLRIKNQTEIKKLMVFLSNNGFYLPNFFKFNTKNTFEIYKSYDLYKLNKKSNDFKIYVFNVFDYCTNNGKSDTKQTIIIYVTKNLYNLYNEWLQQKNIIQINDLNNHYLNNNDKKLLKQIRNFKKPEFDKERFIDEINTYESRISIDWEKEALNDDYYHNMAFEYMEYNIDIDIDIKKESHINFDISKYPVIEAFYENGCVKYSHKPNGALLKAQYKKELKNTKKYSENFKKSLLLMFDDLYKKGLIQDMDL